MSSMEERDQDSRLMMKEARKQDAIQRNLTICDDCKKQVFWAKNRNNKSILMDLEVSEAGHYEVVPAFKLLAYKKDWHEREKWKRDHNGHPFQGHTCHFDTCEAKERSTVVEVAEAKRKREAK